MNFSNFTFNPNVTQYHNEVNIAEFYQNICGQLNHHITYTGLWILIIAIFIHWFNWWFFNHGYKYFNVKSLEDIDNRIYWDTWIKAKLIKLMMGYITLVVYFNLWKWK